MPRISFRLSEATASAYLPDGSRPNQIQTELQLELREATLVEVGIKLKVLPAGIRLWRELSMRKVPHRSALESWSRRLYSSPCECSLIDAASTR